MSPPKADPQTQKGPSRTRRSTEKAPVQDVVEPESDHDNGDGDDEHEEDVPLTRRRSVVSIADSPLPSGEHPDELTPRPTPRNRQAEEKNNPSDKAQLPAPYDDIFKSSFWPSVPLTTTSLETQITNVKLDMMMAYIQDIRLSLNQPGRSALQSRESSSTRAKSSTTRRSSTLDEYKKFIIADDDMETTKAKAKTITRQLEEECTQAAVRLFIMANPDYCGYTKLGKNVYEAGKKFRDYLLELGQNFAQADRASMEAWDGKESARFLLDRLKERRRVYNRENPTDETPMDVEDQTAATPRDDTSLFIPEDEVDSSEPLREAVGGKSTGKTSGRADTKRAKPATASADTERTSTATPGPTTAKLPVRGGRTPSQNRGRGSGRASRG